VIVVDPRATAGTRIDDVTRSIDIAPTILDLLGLPVPVQMEGVSLKGRIDGRSDRLDLMAFEETGVWFTRIPGLSEGHLHYPDLPDLLTIPDKASGTLAIKPEYRDLVIRAKDRAVRSAQWKLAYMPMESGVPRLMLFDLAQDGSCSHDVSALHRDRVRTLLGALGAWAPAHELQRHSAAPGGAEHPPSSPPRPESLANTSRSVIEEQP
jgi:hypothetical protein